MSARLPVFDALDNFRDYGGHVGGGGRPLPRGRLLRSGHHANLTEADLERLAGLDIGTVVDLRRPSERRRQPSRRPEGFAGQVVESDHDDGGEAPHITFLKTSDLTEASGRDFMISTYRRLPFDPAHIDLFRRYFEALETREGAVLIHCAAGKDRTGVLAALTHAALGVGREAMVEDYMMTNRAVDLEARAPDIARQLETWTGRKASHAAVVAFLGVDERFLDAALDEIADRHGSTDAYLETVLGVDAAARDRLAERLCG